MRKVMFFSVMILILVISVACSGGSTMKEDSQDSPRKPKETMTVEEAVEAGHVVVKTRKNTSHEDFITYDTVKVYHLKKIFRFDRKIDQGESAKLKIITFREGSGTRTARVSFDGKVIHYSSGDRHYKCKAFSTYNGSSNSDTASVGLQKCSQDGKKLPYSVTVLSVSMEHFQQVKEAFKENHGGTE
ncbi:MAG TPA: hypothetical protein VFT51_14040 [Bacillales bacterium]|nr:hypothetical protein [Bacillales bacterium]